MVGVLHAVTGGLGGPVVDRVAGFLGSTLSSGVTSISLTGLTVGDLIVAAGGTQAANTDPTFTSGWTKIVSANTSLRRMVVVYRFASATSHTLTFTGSGSSAGRYSCASVFRNASGIGAVGTVNGGSEDGSTFSSPNLAVTRAGRAALWLATYVANVSSAPGGMTVANGHAYLLRSGPWAGGNYSTADINGNCSALVEIY